jgi:uncharacterized metal-binding protein YceD (DUF177 family)
MRDAPFPIQRILPMREVQAEREHNGWWSLPIAADDVDAEAGAQFELFADSEVRDAIARIAGLRELPRLEAAFDVRRRGDGGLLVTGRVSATVGQTCVVTLEPLISEVDEAFDLVFAAPTPGATAEEAAIAADKDVEVLVDGRVDLGAIAVEFLLLGLDPYPRKAGAMFEPPNPPAAEEGPFAALASLKKGQDGA